MCVGKKAVWKDGSIKKVNYTIGRVVPSSYTVVLDIPIKTTNHFFNVLSANLRKVSQVGPVDINVVSNTMQIF